jgi:preprotein translocase subunit SecE
MAETTRTSTVDFLRDVREQITKVTWPDREQLKSSTGVIVVFMLVIALVILLMDTSLRVILDFVTSLFIG